MSPPGFLFHGLPLQNRDISFNPIVHLDDPVTGISDKMCVSSGPVFYFTLVIPDTSERKQANNQWLWDHLFIEVSSLSLSVNGLIIHRMTLILLNSVCVILYGNVQQYTTFLANAWDKEGIALVQEGPNKLFAKKLFYGLIWPYPTPRTHTRKLRSL